VAAVVGDSQARAKTDVALNREVPLIHIGVPIIDLLALQDVIDIINADQGLGLSASINAVGNGITLHDDSAGGGVVSISDVSGTLAADLGIAGQFDAASSGEIASGNLDRQCLFFSRAQFPSCAGSGSRA
jgi:hypothetical protein